MGLTFVCGDVTPHGIVGAVPTRRKEKPRQAEELFPEIRAEMPYAALTLLCYVGIMLLGKVNGSTLGWHPTLTLTTRPLRRSDGYGQF